MNTGSILFLHIDRFYISTILHLDRFTVRPNTGNIFIILESIGQCDAQYLGIKTARSTELETVSSW